MSEPVDLTNCDREPIHIPGSIQPHGTLLVVDPALVMIQRHADNAVAMLAVTGGDDLNGQALDAIVGATAAHEIRNALARSPEAARPGLAFNMPVGPAGTRFDVSVHRHDGAVLLEFELAPAAGHASPLELTRVLSSRLGSIRDVDELVRTATRLIRGLLGYDRVMIYRFAPDGSGLVASEARRSDLESFQGQHFPASDIPQQARQLYLKNTIRIISDSSGSKSEIHPVLDDGGRPLDLSFAHLRSVSPIHLEYLRNMGVGASMSVSIVVGGELWGLIACHHYSPRVLSLAQRVAVEMFGEFFALHLEAMANRRKLETATQARQALDRLLRQAAQHTNILALLQESLPNLIELMPSDGIGLWMNGVWTGHARTPPPEMIPKLAAHIAKSAPLGVWSSHQLSSVFAEGDLFREDASGVLAIPLSQRPRDYLFFFRREVVQTVEWAGNPEKQYGTGPLGDRLTPRKSFAIWKETVERQSRPWTAEDLDIAEAARAALVETVLHHNELLADERSRAELRQKMLNEELNHRVKNILALIKSLLSHQSEDGRSLHDYVESLRGRIQALSYAHDQVVRGDGGGSLADLLRAELSPYRDSATSIVIEGPPVALDSRAFSVMALVLHELATNAAKYGALSKPNGELRVSWTYSASTGCAIDWRESGGPAVSPPSRRGFGSILIDRSIPYDLGGKSEIQYGTDGVSAHFFLPAAFVQPLAAEVQVRVRDVAATSSADHLTGLRILLLEDQLLIAMDAETMLADGGAAIVETAASAAEGLRKLRDFTPDIAVLDVNLGSGNSMPVAEELTRRNIPFVFATGYGDSMAIPVAFARNIIVRKPYDAGSLTSALARVASARRPLP